ncbi:MAG TPA: L-aspartate oxidase [Thermoanaerobaculia bacterium]|nr:L-aspartate oxidase [Thermoanaerobaculia bacterium]
MNRPRRIEEVFSHDVVVVGAGLAGLTAALGLAPRTVALLTKTQLGQGGASNWAQGGMAAAVGSDDSPVLHAQDTLAVSGGLGDPAVAELLAREGKERVARLLELGVAFDREPGGDLALGREAAHSRRRILHAHGDSTGAEMVRALTAAVVQAPEIRPFAGCFVEDLAQVGNRVVGVVARHPEGTLALHLGRAVILATGGIGRAYLHTTNPLESTGDGLAMAARAGARLTDLEMVQFHPTALATGADPMPLVTEALRGEGAWLLDSAGHRFMLDEHPLAELAPRDVVARAIHRRLLAGDRVVLDAREALGERFPDRFPRVFQLCQEAGVDPRTQPIPVSPAAHYHMGGVACDLEGRSSLPGLWVCGEVSSTGAHGANRLASNSLLEAVVFGGRVAADIASSLPPAMVTPRLSALPLPPAGEPERDAELVLELRRRMWLDVGLCRDEQGLERALRQFAKLEGAGPDVGGEARNLLLVARSVATAALARRESRGSHFRSDYPAANPALAHRASFVLARGQFVPVQGESVAPAAEALG